MEMSTAGNRVRTGVLLALSMIAPLLLAITHASPALSQETSTVRVSNLGQPSVEGSRGIGFSHTYAQSFCTGSGAVTLDKVRLRVRSLSAVGNAMGFTPHPAPVVTLRSDSSGRPGGVLQTLANPVIEVAAADKDFTSSGYALAANTVYWVVLHRPNSTGHIAFVETASDAEDSGVAPGWSIGDAYLLDTGSGLGQQMRRYDAMQMAVYASSDSPSVSFPAFPDSDCDGTVGTYELSVSENAAAGTLVGRVAADDADGDSLTYSVGGTDAAKFNSVFDLGAGTGEITVKAGASIDYESVRSYSVTVSVTDGEDATGAAELVPTADATASARIVVVDADDPGVITVAPSAAPQVESELTVSLSDPDAPVRLYRVQWARADTATGEFADLPLNPKFNADPTYTPTAADEGKFLKVTVMYVELPCSSVSSVDSRCRRQAEMTLDTAVAAAPGGTENSPATGAPGVTGTFSVGGTLTATTTGISDSDGLTSATFTYQWLADDTDISGSTGSTYAVTAADAGKAFKVRVAFTDDDGHQESLTSQAVQIAQAQVAPENDEQLTLLDDEQDEEDTTPQETSTVRVSNLGQPSVEGSRGIGFSHTYAQSFCTGSGAVTLDKVRLRVRSLSAVGNAMGFTPHPAPVVKLRSDSSGRPGGVLQTLANPVIEVAAADKDFTSSGYALAANTVYWVVLHRPNSTGHIAFVETASDAEDSGVAPGWSIGDAYLLDTGSGLGQQMRRYDAMQMAVYASSDSPSVSFPAFPDSDCDGTVGTYELSVSENAAAGTLVGRVAADDADGDSLTYSVGGTDAAKFNSVFDLGAGTGEITVKAGASIDYESVRSYSVTVSVTDGEDATGAAELVPTADATASARIVVVDADDPGVITVAPSAAPQVESELTVSLSDPDAPVRLYRVQWARADTATGEFADLPLNPKFNADPTYTPTAADEGKFLKVTVMYVELPCSSVSSVDSRCRRQAEMTLDTAVAAAPGGTENSPATGAPGVTGTFSVGGTLTATTTGISDSDGLTSATFTYQWLADDTDISGSTGSTYAVTAADAGKAFKVRVAFTDDDGHQESLTSQAVQIAQAQVAPENDEQDTTPLTATTHRVPESHDGSTAFAFELRFSEEPGGSSGFSYTTLKQHAFTVTGGVVVRAGRMEAGKNVRWKITVRPSSQADVTIVLPVTTDCTALGAICTGDSRPLSTRVELTIAPRPLTASIHGAPQSHDGSNAFTFELRFSDAPGGSSGFSYTTLQQHAFTVTGGTLNKARRLQLGKNLWWEITVQPSSNADVTIVLPVTADCAAQGAICAGDSRPLSAQVELTVPGPGG